MPEVHALLSASSSHKWLHCTPSARLEASMPDSTSSYAAAGTLAHSLCELKLRKALIEPGMQARTYNAQIKKLQKSELYVEDMDRNSDLYVDYIKEIAYAMPAAPYVVAEKQVDYSNWVPEGFGTSDCILIGGAHLHVIDYKNGQGVAVSADNNPQMKLYALGAYNAYSLLYPITDVTMHIVQPNIHNMSSWSTTMQELLTWGESIRPIAEKAYKGEGEYCQGDWCDSGFCRARASCRHRMEQNLDLYDMAKDDNGVERVPPLISLPEAAVALRHGANLVGWYKKLEQACMDALLSGQEVPGYKLVEGRSIRQMDSPDDVMTALVAAGYAESVITERKPLSLSQLEKVVDKTTCENILQPHTIRPAGKPTMVPVEDKRPAMTMKPTAEEAFGGANIFNN